MGKIGDTKAVEPLIEILSDEKARVRLIVTIALGKINTPDALKAVEEYESKNRL
jgi:HEAT repeat protein